MHVRRFATHVEVATPAKINLFLEVLAKRPDGYHEIETLITAVSWYDTLIFSPAGNGEISLACRWVRGAQAVGVQAGRVPASQRKPATAAAAHELLYNEIPGGQENLVWRAVERLRERSGMQQGATLQLVKRIPAAAGLGGASSDAAAALVAANIVWGLAWPVARLVEVAAELGSDVPFFLTRGAALCRGRGEQLERLPPPRLHVVVVRPPVGLSTPEVYKNCQPATEPQSAAPLCQMLARGDVPAAGRQMVNRLQPAAAKLTPWIRRLEQEFARQGVVSHQMTGSGSSYFGLCRSARHARQIAARLRGRDIGMVFAAATAVAG